MQNDNSQLKSATIALFRNSEEGLLLYCLHGLMIISFPLSISQQDLDNSMRYYFYEVRKLLID
jgi:hypothetical protein